MSESLVVDKLSDLDFFFCFSVLFCFVLCCVVLCCVVWFCVVWCCLVLFCLLLFCVLRVEQLSLTEFFCTQTCTFFKINAKIDQLSLFFSLFF